MCGTRMKGGRCQPGEDAPDLGAKYLSVIVETLGAERGILGTAKDGL